MGKRTATEEAAKAEANSTFRKEIIDKCSKKGGCNTHKPIGHFVSM